MLLCGAAEPRNARLCVSRPEQDGRVNIIPVQLRINSANRPSNLSISLREGGILRCLPVATGTTILSLRFPYPYGGAGEAVRYWTVKKTVSLHSGMNEFVLDTSPNGFRPDASRWSDNGWHEMWDLARRR